MDSKNAECNINSSSKYGWEAFSIKISKPSEIAWYGKQSNIPMKVRTAFNVFITALRINECIEILTVIKSNF